MARKIPCTMMTQHPDSASRYIPIQEEPREAIEALTPQPGGLGIEEIMIDFEGKLTPYHQTAQVVGGLLDAGLTPGRDVFVTPRIASATKETTFKQLMALLSVVETNCLALERSKIPAVTEVILPMVENAEEVMSARRRIEHVIRLAHAEFGIEENKNAITVIPIVEEVPQLIGIKKLLGDYISQCREEGFSVDILRYMLARSDPALSYGMVPAILSCKAAISRVSELGREHGIEAAPILGAGSLPFRGHITPANIENILREYSGIRSITVQSGLRYDHPREEVLKMIAFLNESLPSSAPLEYTSDEYEFLTNVIGIFTRTYVEVFGLIMEPVALVSDLVPMQRDRLARKSTVGYARDIARPEKVAEFVADGSVREKLLKLGLGRKIELPRAISFTSALYTMGLPPEFLGTGRGLKEVATRYGESGLKELLRLYPGLKEDLGFAGRFLHFRNAKEFFPTRCATLLKKDIEEAQEILGIEFTPLKPEDERHRDLMEIAGPMLRQLASKGREFLIGRETELGVINDCIIRMGKIRGSLG